MVVIILDNKINDSHKRVLDIYAWLWTFLGHQTFIYSEPLLKTSDYVLVCALIEDRQNSNLADASPRPVTF